MQVSHLALLLTAQLGLAGMLWYSNYQPTESQPLLASNQLTELTLVKGPGKTQNAEAKPTAAASFSLRQHNGQWQFNAGNAEQTLWLAANPAKVQQLLTDLQKARLNWPLADSADSQRRFAVAPDQYHWQLQLKAAGTDTVQTLWLGDSAGFRQQYLRRDGDNAVYQIALNSYELSVEPEQWLDKNQLGFKDIQAVRGPDYSLLKTQPAATGTTPKTDKPVWQLAGLTPVADAAAPALDQNQADQLLNSLQTLTVQQYVAKPSAEATAALAKAPRLTVTAANRDGKTSELSLQLAEAGGQYWLRRSDLDAVFSMEQSQYQSLVSTNLAKLSKPAEQQVAGTTQSPGTQALDKLSQQLQPGNTASQAAATAQPEQNTTAPDKAGAAGNARP
ncbi:MAG: DUF4340 domain-containing protein [Rheinheimera sp.]|nr:MAG: DUF4340 domain-containing protein [Rheinheimera sp.]